MTIYLRKDLQSLTPYATKELPCQFKLDANESSFPMPAELKERLQQEVEAIPLNRYPDGEATKLREAIGQYHQISKESILCGNGSDEILQMISLAFLEPDDCFLWPEPSFGMYEIYGKYAHGKSITLSLTKELKYDLPQWLRAIQTLKPKIIYLCTPNNPTGTLLSKEELEQIIAVAPGLVVIDEAYGEFAQQNLSQWVLQFPNVLLLKTLSKAFGFAGLRLGYCIGQEQLIQQLSVVKGPYNLNILTQQLGTVIFQYMDEFEPIIEQWVDLRETLYRQLCAFPELTVYPSHGNFLFIHAPNSQLVFEQLLSAGVLVRRYKANSSLENCLRITVGTEAANQQIVDILATHLGKEISNDDN